MKLIGIDYGEKKVGVALSDAEGLMAFPKAVFPNSLILIKEIKDLISSHRVEAIVVGESKGRHGKDNPVMRGARQFAKDLEWETGLPVHFEPEFYSSAEAKLLKEQATGKTAILVDAEAAAVILNSYITRTRTGEL